jgi:hypothetical protein
MQLHAARIKACNPDGPGFAGGSTQAVGLNPSAVIAASMTKIKSAGELVAFVNARQDADRSADQKQRLCDSHSFPSRGHNARVHRKLKMQLVPKKSSTGGSEPRLNR